MSPATPRPPPPPTRSPRTSGARAPASACSTRSISMSATKRAGPPAELLFPRAEFARRLAAVRAAMTARNVDLLIVDETEILHYLTGYAISQNVWRCCLVP
ncbi:MAG: hypothetical protein FJX52_08455, partial [Alphaproteobacteria bacterium]|nr:hypothetical protein [Alphaproteobacteria bacterium]